MPNSRIGNTGADPLKKVVTGDNLRIPAATYNAFIDAALAAKNGGREGKSGKTLPTIQTGVVLVENNSGDDVDRFGILSISGPILDPDDNIDQFQAAVKFVGAMPAANPYTTPSPPEGYGRFVVTLEPIANGAIGRAVISGVVCCQVNMVNSDDTFADVSPGETGYLDSNGWGAAEILWSDTPDDSGGEGDGGDYDGSDDSDATSPVWALVRLGRSIPQPNFVVASYAASSEGTASLGSTFTKGNSLSLESTQVTAKDQGLYLAFATVRAASATSETATVTATLEGSAILVTDTLRPTYITYATADEGDDGWEVTGTETLQTDDFTTLICPVYMNIDDYVSLSLSWTAETTCTGYVGVLRIA